MNILELQDNLKDLPDSALMREMQMPSGSAPQFLVLSELKRRKRMRDEFQRQEASNMPTVAEEVVTAAGMPQQGIMQAARAMAPNTNMAQNTGMDTAAPVPATRAPQMMADGGVVKMQTGGITEYPSINPLIGNVDLSQIAAMLQSGADKEALVANYGADAVREAESMLLPFMKKFIGQIPLGRYPSTFSRRDIRKMEDQGIFGNKSYRDIGGEGIGSVSADVEDFTATDTNYTGQGGTLPAELIPMQSILASDPVTRIQADRAGISVDEYISQMSPEARAQNLLRASGQGPEFDKGAELAAYGEFIGTPSMYRPEAGMPTQEDLDLRAQEAAAEDVFPEYVSPNDQAREYNIMQELQRQAAIERGGYEAAARAEDAPTFTGDVLPFLGDASVAAGKSLFNSIREGLVTPDDENPMLSMIEAATTKKVGPDDVIAELREQNLSVEDKAAQLGLTPITGKDGEPYFISPAGMVFAQEGEDLTPVSGGAAMNIMDVAQNQGKDFSKSPLGEIPFGSYATDEAGNVLPDSYTPMAPIDISGIKSPDFLEGALGPESTIGSVLNVQEGAAPTTSVSEEGVRVFPASPDPSLLSDATTIAEQAAEAAEDTIDMDALTAEADEERAGYEAAAKALQEVEKDPDAPKVPKVDPDPAGFGSTDSRIAKMLSERQKQAESDKWMALAQAGFQIMASKSPTLLGAVGEGGQAGLKALSASKKGMRDFETDMLKLETQLAAARLRSQGTGKTSATAYAALERSYSEALELATQNPSAPNLERLKELEDLVREARAVQFGAVTAGNTNSGVIKTPSAQAG